MKNLSKTFKRMWTSIVVFAIVVIMSVMMLGVSVFAATDAAVTTEMLEPVLEGAKANIAVIVPVAIGLFVIVLGISFIPMLFKKFKHS